MAQVVRAQLPEAQHAPCWDADSGRLKGCPRSRQAAAGHAAAEGQVDLKKLAAHQEAEQLTGLQVGGISPLALLNKRFAVLMDEAARRYEQIYISVGQRDLNLKLPTADLVKLCNARLGDFLA